ncbi:hypothetical protein N9164_13575 [Draconibacterium sp.]|nr:hypothetical protein [Draconibacterium sp.]
MNATKINSIKQFLSSSQEEKRMMFENGVGTDFIVDIKSQLESKVYDTLKLSMQLVQKLKINEAVPVIFKNIQVYNSIDPLGTGFDPVSLIIDLGSNNADVLLDCVASDPTDENIRIAAKIMFHWFIRESDKMKNILAERKPVNKKAEDAILEYVQSELDTYNKSK